MSDKYFILNNGNKIPVIGYGTGITNGISKSPFRILKYFVREKINNILVPGFKVNNKYPLSAVLKKDRMLREALQIAADNGCRMFDTARAYGCSENYLGEALLKNGKYERTDFFVITKVTNTAQRNGNILEDFESSLANIGTDYVDLLLLHWPQTGTYLEAWKVLEDIYESGKARAIGVCNCHVHHLEEIKKVATVLPMVNELECHPLLQQKAVREYCTKEGIQIIAHTPTGKMNKDILESKTMIKISEKYNVGISQVILRWHYQLGDISIPNSTSEKHVVQNLDIFGFELTETEMKEIAAMDCNYRVWPDPDNCDFTKL